MMKETIGKYHKKLQMESIIKSLIYGFSIGSILAFIVTIIFYIKIVDGLWIILVVWLGVSLISTILIKLLLFNLSIKDTAARMDSQLELEERVITMVEYNNASSLIIDKQRTNAKEKLMSKNPNELKFLNVMKPLIALTVLLVLTLTMATLTSLKVEAHYLSSLTAEKSPEDIVIEELISELRDIVEDAQITSKLKEFLNQRIDRLETDLQFDETLIKKIARIEDARREITDIIEEELRDKTSIIDELKTHDTSNPLGMAFESEDESIIADTINQVVADFIAKSTADKEAYVESLATDIEQSVMDADIKNSDIEEELEELITLLRELIPTIDGVSPDESGDALQEILEEISEALSAVDEETTSEEISEAIEEALDELEEIEESGEEPGEEPDEEPVEEPEEEDGNDDGEEDGTGESEPLENPLIIDGETEYSQAIYDLIRQEMIDMIENGTISDEELITLVNEYLKNIELTDEE